MDVLVAWLDWTRAGDLASIFGLLTALVGFAVTIYNVRASKSAAVRAERAALDARRAIGFFDAITELSAAIATLEEIRRMHRDGVWRPLPDRYNGLKKSLLGIRSAVPDLSSDHRSRLQQAIRDLAALEAAVENMLEEGSPHLPVARWNTVASGHIMELHELLLELQRRAGDG